MPFAALTIILSGTPIASWGNGTGIRTAADCSNWRCWNNLSGVFSSFLNLRQRVVDRILIDPLTASKSVSVTRSWTDLRSFFGETIASWFSGEFWTQLFVKEFSQPESILTSYLVSVFTLLNFWGISRRNQTCRTTRRTDEFDTFAKYMLSGNEKTNQDLKTPRYRLNPRALQSLK